MIPAALAELAGPAQPWLVLVAPGGYGKSHWLQHWAMQAAALGHQLLQASFAADFSDAYFLNFNQACAELGLPVADPAQGGEAWARQLQLKQPCWVLLDRWESLEKLERVQAFWQAVWQQPPQGLKLLLASRKPPRLPLAELLAAGGRYLDRESLSWPLDQTLALWQQHGLSWEPAHQQTWEAMQGWPLGLSLYLRYVLGELSSQAYALLLQQALQSWLPPFAQEPAQVWASAYQAQLEAWQASRSYWPPVLAQALQHSSRLEPQYWLWQATRQGDSPRRARVFLERAQSLCLSEQRALQLSILTRQAHNASLSGEWAELDRVLAQAEALLEDGRVIDQAAWYYLRANRLRQCCQYAQAHLHLDSLLALSARHPSVLDFQTRARIMRGLTAYQQGDYARTLSAYQQALILAQSDGNTQMQLELSIMLAFLAALTGQQDQALPAEICEQVAALPLNAQPLVWLNLAFYQILGEHLDLEQGQTILERVRHSAQTLEWQALEPLIADVEARLWRFHQDYARADRLHRQALEVLEPQTFDWLYASLNHALTLLRQQRSSEARELLQTVSARAEATGTLGLWREARAALLALDPSALSGLPVLASQDPHLRPAMPRLSGDQPLLEIQTFGHFQVRLNGVPIERWPRKRSRHILIQILLHPHGIHRETLADWLTGSDDLEQALRSLDVQIHTLRKVLEPERKGKQASRYIQFHDACYSFNWDAHYAWDIEPFSRQYQLWLQQREPDPAAAEAAVAKALQIYQGHFLPELDFADDWLAERESYLRKASDLVHWSLEYLVQTQHYEQAEERAEQLLRWDLLSESGFSWLFRIAGQLQDRSRLERLGERMEQTYEKELGAPPPAELLQRYREINRQLTAV